MKSFLLIVLLVFPMTILADPAVIVKNGIVYDAPVGYEAVFLPIGVSPRLRVLKKVKTLEVLWPVSQEVAPGCAEPGKLVLGPTPPCKPTLSLGG